MKKIYIDFEMNMPNNRSKREIIKADIIAIGAIQYDTDTGSIEKFKSLIKPISSDDIYPHIKELTQIKSDELRNAPTYEEVMRRFKKWLGIFSEIEGIYTFGNLDLICLNYTDMKSAKKYNHPRFINNIRDLFVDIKDKYLDYGIKCMNYISLKNLLNCINIEFSGEAHDPLNDSYNLFVLDKILENNINARNILVIQDMIKHPFIDINESLKEKFDRYKSCFYNNEGSYNIEDLSIEIIKTVNMYIESIKDIDNYNIDMLRDINRKLDTIDKIKDIEEGYFYLLENIYYDMKDLLEDLILCKLNNIEYKNEVEKIINLFNEELKNEKIYIESFLVESC